MRDSLTLKQLLGPHRGAAAAACSAYDRTYYERTGASARSSAEVVVPLLLEAVPAVSVVDVGCGSGGWLRSFAAHGVHDVLGLDTEQVPRDLLQIAPERFRSVDLSAPPRLDRVFDLAISLEVAEHLPESAADDFVAFLSSLAPVIAFSAAIPGQGGVEHQNEQWPAYWAERFSSHGFRPLDVLRGLIWEDERVEWFYRQNLLLYLRQDIKEDRRIAAMHPTLPEPPLSLVHPASLVRYQALRTPPSLSAVLRALPHAVHAALSRRWQARSLRGRGDGPNELPTRAESSSVSRLGSE